MGPEVDTLLVMYDPGPEQGSVLWMGPDSQGGCGGQGGNVPRGGTVFTLRDIPWPASPGWAWGRRRPGVNAGPQGTAPVWVPCPPRSGETTGITRPMSCRGV